MAAVSRVRVGGGAHSEILVVTAASAVPVLEPERSRPEQAADAHRRHAPCAVRVRFLIVF
jgi:hypothetical protein